MIFKPTDLDGVWILEPERRSDNRGHFARTFDRDELAARGLVTDVVQCSTSYNRRRGTVRGLHLQAPPFAETKLVRVTRGAIFDVAVDVRPDSPTRGRHVAVVLDAEAGNQVYVPAGFAHGFQTLADDTEVFYQISAPFSAEHARGYRWDDPTLAIPWPEPMRMISDRDLLLPRFGEDRVAE